MELCSTCKRVNCNKSIVIIEEEAERILAEKKKNA